MIFLCNAKLWVTKDGVPRDERMRRATSASLSFVVFHPTQPVAMRGGHEYAGRPNFIHAKLGNYFMQICK